MTVRMSLGNSTGSLKGILRMGRRSGGLLGNDQLESGSRKEGWKEGRKEGREEGRKEGSQGRKEGKKKGKKEGRKQ